MDPRYWHSLVNVLYPYPQPVEQPNWTESKAQLTAFKFAFTFTPSLRLRRRRTSYKADKLDWLRAIRLPARLPLLPTRLQSFLACLLDTNASERAHRVACLLADASP